MFAFPLSQVVDAFLQDVIFIATRGSGLFHYLKTTFF